MPNYKTVLQLPVGTTPYQLTFEQPNPGKGVPLTAEDLDTGVGALKIFAIQIDNTANASASFLKLWDANPGGFPTVTPPEILLQAQASTTVQYSFTPPLDAVTLWGAVHDTPAIGATGTSAPLGTVTTRILVGA